MAYGLWTMAYGLWTMAYDLWTMAYGLTSYLSTSFNDPLISGHFAQSHGAARVQLLGRDAHFGTEAEFAAVGKLGARVHEHGGSVDLPLEPRRSHWIFRDDCLGMP